MRVAFGSFHSLRSKRREKAEWGYGGHTPGDMGGRWPRHPGLAQQGAAPACALGALGPAGGAAAAPLTTTAGLGVSASPRVLAEAEVACDTLKTHSYRGSDRPSKIPTSREAVISRQGPAGGGSGPCPMTQGDLLWLAGPGTLVCTGGREPGLCRGSPGSRPARSCQPPTGRPPAQSASARPGTGKALEIDMFPCKRPTLQMPESWPWVPQEDVVSAERASW